jgi:serine phosphatase RsbU (regulator of sigma subunit)
MHSIRSKVIVSILIGLLVAGVTSVLAVRSITERNKRTAAQQALQVARAVYDDLERNDVEKLSTALDAIATREDLQAAFVARDRDRLLALAAPLFERLRRDHGITHWYFLEAPPERRCFLRVHAPRQFADVVRRVTLSRSIESGGMGAGIELGKTAFALRVVKPYVVKGTVAGYLELGEEIDHFLARMKAQTGDDFGLLVEKRHLDEQEWAGTRAWQGKRDSWSDRPEDVVVDATADGAVPPGVRSGAVPDGGLLLGEVARGGKVYAQALFPVRDVDGRRVGAIALQHDITAVHASLVRGRYEVMAVLALLGAAMLIFILVLLDRLVFRRLGAMTSTMRSVAQGDLTTRLPDGYEEELDTVAQTFNGMVTQLDASRRELARTESVRREMQIAHLIQTSILPRQTALPGFDVAARMKPADDVGGDLYDLRPCGGDRFWVLVGDVSGHGIQSGLVMLMAQAAAVAQIERDPECSPAAVVAAVNRVLYENVRSRMARDDYLTFMASKHVGEGRFVAAGRHQPIFVRRVGGEVELIETVGPWCGIAGDVTDAVSEYGYHLEPGDQACLISDGIVEAPGLGGLFGEERLAAVLSARTDSADAALDRLFRAVEAHMDRQLDDMTAVIIRREPAGPPAGAGAGSPETTRYRA